MRAAAHALAVEAERDRQVEVPANPQGAKHRALQMWRSIGLRMFLIQRCLMYQHTLNGCDEVRRRKWNTLQEKEQPKKTPAKKKSS